MDIVYKPNPRSGRETAQDAAFNPRSVVRVIPKETLRRVLKHGVTKVGFLSEGSAEWPNDQFTKRRILKGDVTLESPTAQADQAQPQGRQQRRIEDKKTER
jgi:hypothetical protein